MENSGSGRLKAAHVPLQYWLMKSEPAEFSFDDLRRRPRRTEPWDGVRNYQARNMMRDQMRKGDLAFFYHSNCAEPGIVGTMEIAGAGRPDPTAFDPADAHYDPKSRSESPRWYLVSVRYQAPLPRPLPLSELRRHRALDGLALLRPGNRLSVMPITRPQWGYILKLAQKPP